MRSLNKIYYTINTIVFVISKYENLRYIYISWLSFKNLFGNYTKLLMLKTLLPIYLNQYRARINIKFDIQ